MRRWRETTTVTAAQAAKQLGTDTGRISRLERGVYRFSTEEIRTLASMYGVADSEGIEEVVRAAEEPTDAGWWTPYANRLAESYRDFIELEADARTLRLHNPVIIPGLLQSPGYVREMLTKGPTAVSRTEAEMLVNVRLARQEILTRDHDPVAVHALLPESAFHPVLAPLVMRDQLQRLLDLAALPQVTVQIIPLTAHPSFGSNGAMTLMTYRNPWVPVASVDNAMGGTHTEEPDKFEFLEKDFRGIVDVALSAEQSREVITEHLEGLHK